MCVEFFFFFKLLQVHSLSLSLSLSVLMGVYVLFSRTQTIILFTSFLYHIILCNTSSFFKVLSCNFTAVCLIIIIIVVAFSKFILLTRIAAKKKTRSTLASASISSLKIYRQIEQNCMVREFDYCNFNRHYQ